jgi:hypothetical protein
VSALGVDTSARGISLHDMGEIDACLAQGGTAAAPCIKRTRPTGFYPTWESDHSCAMKATKVFAKQKKL